MTSYLPPITELTLFGAFERNVANKERVVLKAEASVDLGTYAVVLGWRKPGEGVLATPIADAMYWLSSKVIPPNDWVFLYTGPGTSSVIRSHDQKNNLHIMFWNRQQTVFNNPNIVPMLWRLNGIVVEKTPVGEPNRSLANIFNPIVNRRGGV